MVWRKSGKSRNKVVTKILLWGYETLSELVILLYRVLNKPLVYVIGDSHTFSFLLQLPFIVRYLGPATAYGLGKGNNNTLELYKILSKIDKKKDRVLLVFGEIDSRIHILNQLHSRQGKHFLGEIVISVVNSYGKILLDLKIKGFLIYVYGIPPASILIDNTYNYSYYGSPNQRSIISQILNVNLEGFCTENKIPYINTQRVTSTPKGFIKPEYTEDKLHLNNKIVPIVRREIYGIISN